MDKIKKYRILGIIFAILTFIGAGIVFYKEGDISPGIAVIPSLFSMIFTNLSNEEKNKKRRPHPDGQGKPL